MSTRGSSFSTLRACPIVCGRTHCTFHEKQHLIELSYCLLHPTLTSEHNTFPFAFTNNASIIDGRSCTYGQPLHLTTRSHSYLIYFFFSFKCFTFSFFLFFLIFFILIFFLKHVLFLNLNESNITLEILFDTSEIILSKNREMKNRIKRKEK